MTAQFECSLSKEYKYNSILGKLLLKFNPMIMCIYMAEASHVAIMVKNPPPNAGHTRDSVSIPGSGRSAGVGSGNPLQYSCLENPMDRGAWWATVHGAPKDQSTHSTCIWLSPFTVHLKLSNLLTVYTSI